MVVTYEATLKKQHQHPYKKTEKCQVKKKTGNPGIDVKA
jgi:hypothetical protein